MQDLREKLLKAGLVDKQQARKAKTEKRRKKKEKKNAQKGGAPSELEVQKERYQQKLGQQAARARDLQQRLNEEQAQHEARERIRNLILTGALKKILGDDSRFHFVGRDRRIRRLTTTEEIAEGLTSGALAIVAFEDDAARDYRVVGVETARRLEELDPSVILFWNKPGSCPGDLPTHGAS